MKTEPKSAHFWSILIVVGAALMMGGLVVVLMLGQSAQAATTAAPGMRVYVDPETGELLDQPPEGTQPIVTPKITLPEPVQVESLVPGGGVEVDVRERFQTPLQIRIRSDGKPAIEHIHELQGTVSP